MIAVLAAGCGSGAATASPWSWLARYLQDRWTAVPLIHLEPFEYKLVSDAPVLVGTLTDPTLVPVATAWGIGPDPWGATSIASGR